MFGRHISPLGEKFFMAPAKIKNKSGPIPKDQRDEIKKIFLEKLAETNHIQNSARAAGISRITAWQWMTDGYIAEEELFVARTTYEEIVRRMIDITWWIKHGRVGYQSEEDPFVTAPNRRLLYLAKSVLPEFGGRQLYHLEYSVKNWPVWAKRDIRERILDYQEQFHTFGRRRS